MAAQADSVDLEHHLTDPLDPPLGVYLHLPFCRAKCGYCDFASVAGRDNQIDSTLDALDCEMSSYESLSVQTLYIGGGTPSVLIPDQIRRLFQILSRHFDLTALTEATVEANPESLEADRLRAFKEGGINRLSVGLQSSHNRLLEVLGRLHTAEVFRDRFQMARDLGLDNINIDLIYGIPGQTQADWRASLEEVVRLQPEHISAYALKIEEGTPFKDRGLTLDEDDQADMYLWASEFLSREGYIHYEISNFAKPGREGRHNLLYWRNQNTLGFGVSAASHVSNQRWKNTESLDDYLRAIQNKNSVVVEYESLDNETHDRETMMLALRLRKGVSLSDIKRLKIPRVETFLKEGLAFSEEDRFCLTARGWLMSNQLFQYFV